jgi:hypothetical protein
MFTNHICGVMVSMFASSAVDREFKAWAGETKDYKISIKEKDQRLVVSVSG